MFANRRNECCSSLASVVSLLKGLFLTVCVLVTIFFVVGYASGWVTIQRNQVNETATIQIDTGEFKSAAGQAVRQGREILDEAGDKIRELGNSAEKVDVPTSTQSRPTTPDTPLEPSRPGNPQSTGNLDRNRT